MPWKPSDAIKHTHKATSIDKQQQWAAVANSVLDKTGDEGEAVRIANAAISEQAIKSFAEFSRNRA